MSIQTVLPIDREAVGAMSASQQEPAWMTKLRQDAVDLAAGLELPALEKTRLDRWNLTNYGAFQPTRLLTSFDELPEEARLLVEGQAEGASIVVQRNSGVVYHSLSAELAEQGVVFTGLTQALSTHSDIIERHFMQAVKPDENKLTALHTALWNGGVFLYVPAHVRIDKPLQALFVSDDASATFAPHVLIIAEAGSSVTYVDNYIGGAGERIVHNGVAEVFAKQGAHVQFASVHDLAAGVTDLCYRRAVVEADARIDWIVGEMNHGESMSDTTSLLKGNGSMSDAKVICVGTNEQKMNITTRAVHFGRHSNSDMITRAVLRDSSTAIINGITKIEKGATHANGEQTERVLMLSPTARGDANPMLLIDEDEVTAGHAASVGQVNPEQVFYMMSRGITREQATRLIIYGFLAPVVSEIPISQLEKQLRTVVERKLGQ